MQKHLKWSSNSLMLSLTLALSQTIQGLETDFLNAHVKNIKLKIVSYLTLNEMGNIRLGNKQLCSFMDGENIDKRIKEKKKITKFIDITEGSPWHKSVLSYYGIIGHEEALKTFLNGKLVYRPDKETDKGMIELKISDLKNPFESSFDLSKCGIAGKFCNISTGHRKKKNPKNADRVETWISFRYMLTKLGCFNDILKDENKESAPFVLLWNWGGWDDLMSCTYLANKSPKDISRNNLYKNWRKGKPLKTLNVPSHPNQHPFIAFHMTYTTFSCSFF